MSTGEIIDILNEDGEIIGTIPREEAEQGNHITENVLVFLFNSLGRVWTQLRPQTKRHFPGTWDISVCGGIHSGETPAQAAERETLEEAGLEVALHHAETFLNVFEGDNGEERKRISHLFVGITDETPTADKAEVDGFRLWGAQDLRNDAAKHPDSYVPSFVVELDKAVAGHKEITN